MQTQQREVISTMVSAHEGKGVERLCFVELGSGHPSIGKGNAGLPGFFHINQGRDSRRAFWGEIIAVHGEFARG